MTKPLKMKMLMAEIEVKGSRRKVEILKEIIDGTCRR